MGVSESSAGRGADPPWFGQPEPDYQQRAKALSNRVDISEAAADYRQGGYLIREFGFSEADLAEAGAYTKAIKTTRVQDAWLVNGAIKRLATLPPGGLSPMPIAAIVPG